jgi:hypothetical protein
MEQKKIAFGVLLALLAGVFTFGIALAHTTVTAGHYDIEVGWLDEPAAVGQRNAVVVNVSDKNADDKEVDVSKLVVNLSYGGQTKALTLQPLSEDAKNQYIAPILPTIAGQYTVQLRGQVGDDGVNVNLDVQPEEVVAADTLAFPNTPPAPQTMRVGDLLTVGALVVALLALVVGFLAFRKAR